MSTASLALAACVAPGPETRVELPPPVQATPKPPNPSGPNSFILVGDARQGGVMRGTAPAGTRRLSFNGTQIPLAVDGQFLIAFDRDFQGDAVLVAERADSTVIERTLPVAAARWNLEYIDAPYTGRTTSEEFRRVRAGELARIEAARARDIYSDGWRQSFRWPVTGRISSVFGSQRIYQGKPGSYHGGVDIAARTGTPFVAPADGVVVLAAQQPFTLEGHLLIVDHGMGLNSAFLHCSSLAVREGEAVRQGQVLGRVGSSGRATGPHLHWGLKWRDARLDPTAMTGPMPEY